MSKTQKPAASQCSKIRKKCNFKSTKKTLFAFSKMAKNQFLHQKKVKNYQKCNFRTEKKQDFW